MAEGVLPVMALSSRAWRAWCDLHEFYSRAQLQSVRDSIDARSVDEARVWGYEIASPEHVVLRDHIGNKYVPVIHEKVVKAFLAAPDSEVHVYLVKSRCGEDLRGQA